MKTGLGWKQLLQEKDFENALLDLRLFATREADPNKLLSAARAIDRIPDEEFKNQNFHTLRIAFLSGYTYDLIVNLTRLFLLSKGIHAKVFKGEYGLFEQAILTADKTLTEFKPDFIHLGVGTEQIRHRENVTDEIQRWVSLWTKANSTFSASIIQDTFIEPAERVFGNYEMKNVLSQTQYVRRLNMGLTEKAPSFVHFNDVDYLASLHGRARWRDWKLFDLSKIPASYENLVHISKNLASVFAASIGRTKKCLVLDLDNTLWGGVVGDLGPEGVAIGQGSPEGEAHLRLQHYILELKKRGVLLSVCSKNDEQNAKEPFQTRKDMAIKLSDISCFVANWEPKPDNIQRIAQELNIGLDSFVFLDDNPMEREMVRKILPQVGIIELSDDPAEYVSALAASAFFETVSLTKEDLERTALYLADKERQRAFSGAETAMSSNDYKKVLEDLQMELIVKPFDSDNLPRITQLINKTNQFNLTTKRYTESQVIERMNDPRALTFQARLQDRFGDNGMISVVIGTPLKQTLEIESWLMSCRVLKRGVEGSLFQEVVKKAKSLGFSRIRGKYIPSAKNAMVKSFYKELGFTQISEDNNQSEWEFNLDEDRSVTEVFNREFPLKVIYND